MKYYDPERGAFVLIGVHGGRLEKEFYEIKVQTGVDSKQRPIYTARKYAKGTKPADIPKHWLQFEEDDTRFGAHPGKRLVLSADHSDLILEDIPPPTAAQVRVTKSKAAKAKCAEAVRNIVVEVDGLEFDGDERSRALMLNAVQLAAGMAQTTPWKLHDNTWVEVTAAQLLTAAQLSGAAQMRIMQEAES